MTMRGSRFRFRFLFFGPVAAAALAAVIHFPVVEAQAPAPSFATTVYPVLEKAGCRACHTDDGVASGTRLHFPQEAASAEEIDAFGLTLAALVNRGDPSSSLLLNKPTNRTRHVGGVKIEPDSADEQVLRAWIAASCRRSRRRHQRGSGAAGGGEAGRRASGRPAPADAQPVQQHGARSGR